MARPRRDVADSGLAFLDVVSCGFGAVILLLIITKSVAPEDTRASAQGLAGDAATLQAAVLSAQGRRDELREATAAAKARIEALKQRLAAQQATEAALEAQARRAAGALADAKEEGRALADARQSLSETLQRLLGQNYRARNDLVGGIPADSEYIIFIIDTSGSMFNYAWDLMTQKLIETLEVYPEVKGIQVMNDMGEYMFGSYAGQWIPDTPDAGPSSRTASAAGAPSQIPLQWRALREPSTPSGRRTERFPSTFSAMNLPAPPSKL